MSSSDFWDEMEPVRFLCVAAGTGVALYTRGYEPMKASQFQVFKKLDSLFRGGSWCQVLTWPERVFVILPFVQC